MKEVWNKAFRTKIMCILYVTSNNRRLESAFNVTRLFVFCPTQDEQVKQAQANLDSRLFLIRPSKIHRPIDRRQIP